MKLRSAVASLALALGGAVWGISVTAPRPAAQTVTVGPVTPIAYCFDGSRSPCDWHREWHCEISLTGIPTAPWVLPTIRCGFTTVVIAWWTSPTGGSNPPGWNDE